MYPTLRLVHGTDLKDPCFHSLILPRRRPFPWFTFEGRAYQYKVLPFRFFLSPRVFTNVAEAALVPLREVGIRILNYLDNWLILAHSRELLCAHRNLVLEHLAQQGLWVKCKFCSMQKISFLRVELDLIIMTAHFSQDRVQVPGAFGILGRGHAAGVDAYETASILASGLSPEMGMVPRPCGHHADLLSHFQPLVGPCISSGRSFPRTSVQMCCCYNRCFQDRLGRCMQHVQPVLFRILGNNR